MLNRSHIARDVQIICGITLLLVLAPCQVNAQEVRATERSTYIDYSGRDLRSVIRKMKAYSRNEHGGGAFFAHTAVQFNYSLTPAPTESGCALKMYEVVVDIEFKMPRWTRVNSASQLDRFHWNKLYSAAWRHERMHGAIAEAMGDELAAILSEVGPEADCDVLSATAKDAANNYLDSSTTQAAFDRYARDRDDPSDFDIAAAVRRN